MTSVKLKTYSNSYGFAIPKDFFELVGFEKKSIIYIKQTGICGLNISLTPLPGFDQTLKISQSGSAQIIVIKKPILNCLGWLPQTELNLSFKDNLVSVLPKSGSYDLLEPNIHNLSTTELQESYKITQARISLLAEIAGGIDNQDYAIIRKGIRILDILHTEWSKQFDANLKLNQ
ncbi:hypothetical protein [Photobacterium damselae]|uniref:hypothetical protein n=1 Tax=Photobacterium damselae TaxID=38293 RepID=UPI004067F5ED